MIKFSTSLKETKLVSAIASRASRLGVNRDHMSLMMDIEAAHCNGMPLDLPRLLEAPDFDLVHDVAGIVRHLNRSTGELEDCFVPRFAKAENIN